MSTRTLSILLLLVVLSFGYDSFDGEQEILNYYQENSQYPIFHVHHNRHFSKSRQFQDFLDVLEQTEYRNKDYARFLLTDCEKVPQGQSYSCDNMRRTKDNRLIVGYYPSSEFINYGGKKMQNPPNSRQYTHPSDVYSVEEIQSFLMELMPNFYEEIISLEQYREWLSPLYSPNLIFATRQDELPEVLIKLGVTYFLKFQLGVLSDLTQNVVAELNITSFPVLLVIKYNFATGEHVVEKYPSTDFSSNKYEDIKSFLEPLSLVEPRNDILFHKMRMPTRSQIQKTDQKSHLAELLDRASGWSIISEVNTQPAKLQSLKQKYGRFFEYYHLLDSSKTKQTLKLFDPDNKKTFQLLKGDIQFKSLNKQEFLSNTSIWLNKNFVIIGARQKYGHFCTIALSNFFRGLAHCLIIKDADYEQVSKALGMQFQYGFVCAQKLDNGTKKISGQNFKSANFEDVYLTSEYVTRLKSKEIVDLFLAQPIKPIGGSDKLAEICAFPTKKCALYFSHPKKTDRTAYDYLSDVAKNFINEYQFYEIDLSCNPQFMGEIQNLQRNYGGLVVYHPRVASYVYLKAKLSKSNFQRFLKANLGENKKLPYTKFINSDIMVHACPKERVENDSL